MNRIPFVTEGVLDIASDINSSLAAADGIITSRISGFLTEPPVSALDDSRYGVSAGASGKWFGKDGQLALYVAEGDFWKFYSPLHVFYLDTLYVSNGFSWTPVEGRLENKGKVVQTKGQSIYDVMSQKSVTDELDTKADTSYADTELFKKVDKVAGQSLFKDTERTKLSGIATGATKNRSDAEMDVIWDTKVDKVVGKELSDTNFTQVEKTKLSGVAVEATKNATDAQLRARASHTGEQPISTVASLQSTLDSKVDKIAGKGLSTSDFTPDEKAKLASLESSKYRGSYPSLAALQAANPNPSAGEYADVDSGVGKDTSRWIWDNNDNEWIDLGAAPALTPAQVKALYEENGDTNAYTDAEKTKLSGIAAESTKNATDAQLRARASHTGVQAISTVTGLQEGLDSKVDKVVGKELSANDFTSVLKTKLDSLPSGVGGLIPLSAGGTGATSAATARTALQLGNASTHNYGTAVNTVMMGNDSRANNGQTAYSWGNHASAGYALEGSLNYTVGKGLALVDKKLDINFGTVAETVVEGNDSRVNNGQAAFNRLNIGATAATARTALQLGTAATRNVGTASGNVMEVDSFILRENVKLTVGASGDFATINEAILHLSRYTPELGVTAEVELVSGFVMMEQLLVEGLDLGWITITGVDAETVINEPSLTRVLVEDIKPAFGIINGTLPTMGQLFNYSSKGSTSDLRSGIMAFDLGRATILDGCGVKNAGYRGIHASRASTINAQGAIASGAGSNGIEAGVCSTINAQGAIASGAGGYGLFTASGSIINASGIDVSDASLHGIYALDGATINVRNANASGAGATGILAAYGSTINAIGADASGARESSISAQNSSTIDATNAVASGGAVFDVRILLGSTIIAQGVTGTLNQAKNTVTPEGIIFQR